VRRDGHITSALGQRTAQNSRAHIGIAVARFAGRSRWMALVPSHCPSKEDRTRNHNSLRGMFERAEMRS